MNQKSFAVFACFSFREMSIWLTYGTNTALHFFFARGQGRGMIMILMTMIDDDGGSTFDTMMIMMVVVVVVQCLIL